MKKQTTEQRLEELEKKVDEFTVTRQQSNDIDPNGDPWITIDYSVIPKETFDRYGAKPFQIMKRKMRRGREVWNKISLADAKEEADKLGLRLPHISEILVLLDSYKKKKGDKISVYDKEFLGIEELSYSEKIIFEIIDGPIVFLRGAYWLSGSDDGAFALNVFWGAGSTYYFVGFRCARTLEI